MPPTTTEASRYQQLRGHLAYLKLADAAEALPAVLDCPVTRRSARCHRMRPVR